MSTSPLVAWAALAFAAACPGQSLRVVCFGDSTTAPRAGVTPYCDLLRAPGIETVNRGVPGNTTEDARRRFDADVVAARPDVAIIQFGLNDSAIDVWKKPPATEPRVALARYRENLAYFVETLQKTGCRVALMTFNPLTWTEKLRGLYGRPPYRADDPAGFDAGREPYLEAVREVARSSGATLVDVYRAYREHGVADLLLDGMHPNNRGHELTASRLRPLLR